MLGLGLGLSKGTNLLSNLKLLTRNSDWAIWGDKATGISKGVNSPATNPIQDLVGNADGTLQGFAFTPASGYVDVVAPNGKTVTGLQGDGVNDVILLPSNAPNPVGLQDFGFAFVFKTPSVFTDGYLFSRNLDSTLTMQVGIFVNGAGSFGMYTNATPLIFGNDGKIVSNKFYKLIITRKSGVLTCKLLDETTYSQSNVISLISRPNVRMFARSNSVDGSANSLFSNVIKLYDNYNNGDNIDAWEADQNKAIAKIYGL